MLMRWIPVFMIWAVLLALPAGVKEMYGKAYSLYEQGKTEEARVIFVTIITKYNKTDWVIPATYYAGICTRDLDQKKEILGTLIDSYRESSYSEDAIYEYGVCNFFLEDYEEAIKSFGNYTLLSSSPSKTRDAQIYLVKSLLAGKYYQETAEQIQVLFSKSPSLKNNELLRLYEFVAFVKSEDYNSAIKYGLRFVKSFPKSSQLDKVYSYLSDCYESTGQTALQGKYQDLLKVYFPQSRYRN